MLLLESKILNKDILITDSAAKEVLLNYDKGMIVENTEQGIIEGIKQMIEKKDTTDERQPFSNATILEDLKELLGE